jgi:hypothetical protein
MEKSDSGENELIYQEKPDSYLGPLDGVFLRSSFSGAEIFEKSRMNRL